MFRTTDGKYEQHINQFDLFEVCKFLIIIAEYIFFHVQLVHSLRQKIYLAIKQITESLKTMWTVFSENSGMKIEIKSLENPDIFGS